jgi:hypothetical protein
MILDSRLGGIGLAKLAEEGASQERSVRRTKRLLNVLLLVTVLLPRLAPIVIAPTITDHTRDTYAAIEALPAGSKVLVDIGADETPWASVGGGMVAIVTHLMSRDLKLLFVSGGSKAGPMLSQLIFDRIPKDVLASKKYGTDYIRTGWVPGEEAAVSSFATNLKGLFTTDIFGASLSGMPLWQSINGANDFRLVFNASQTNQYYYYLRHWGPLKIPLVFAVGTEGSPYLAPFYSGRQLAGFVAGIRGSAEYEFLTGKLGSASKDMTALSLAVILAMGIVVASNIQFFRQRVKSRPGKGGLEA